MNRNARRATTAALSSSIGGLTLLAVMTFSTAGREAPATQANRVDKANAGTAVAFQKNRGQLEITIDGRVIATYVTNDPKTHRPYFMHLTTRDGSVVTRTRPPVAGKDPTDHPDMHPGLWLAFGDIAGHDFWRNKGPRVEHERFAEEPKGGFESGSFTAVNRYVVDDKILCRETAKYTVVSRPAGYLIIWDSVFSPASDGVWFGNQDEMGLGIRLATPLTVKSGNGRITNSNGEVNEKGTWGRQAAWCDYTGTAEGKRVGVTLMVDPAGQTRPWFHSRDYGVLVTNPFGTRATAPAKLELKPGKSHRLRFGVLVHASKEPKMTDCAAEYRQFVTLLE